MGDRGKSFPHSGGPAQPDGRGELNGNDTNTTVCTSRSHTIATVNSICGRVRQNYSSITAQNILRHDKVPETAESMTSGYHWLLNPRISPSSGMASSTRPSVVR